MTTQLTIYPVAPMPAVRAARQPAPQADPACAWGNGECREPAGHGVTGRFCADHAAWLGARRTSAERARRHNQRTILRNPSTPTWDDPTPKGDQ